MKRFLGTVGVLVGSVVGAVLLGCILVRTVAWFAGIVAPPTAYATAATLLGGLAFIIVVVWLTSGATVDSCGISYCNSRSDPRCEAANCTVHCGDYCRGACLSAAHEKALKDLISSNMN